MESPIRRSRCWRPPGLLLRRLRPRRATAQPLAGVQVERRRRAMARRTMAEGGTGHIGFPALQVHRGPAAADRPGGVAALRAGSVGGGGTGVGGSGAAAGLVGSGVAGAAADSHGAVLPPSLRKDALRRTSAVRSPIEHERLREDLMAHVWQNKELALAPFLHRRRDYLL